MADKESLRERVARMGDETSIGLQQGRPVAWHRLLMCGTICLTGLILIMDIVMNYVMHEQAETLQHQPVVGVVENTQLPQGEYFIYKVFLDAKNVNHYVVSSMDGGVLVAVAAPDGTPEPDDIYLAERADSAAFSLRVDEDGKWVFLPTTVYKRLLLEQGKISPAQHGQADGKNEVSATPAQ